MFVPQSKKNVFKRVDSSRTRQANWFVEKSVKISCQQDLLKSIRWTKECLFLRRNVRSWEKLSLFSQNSIVFHPTHLIRSLSLCNRSHVDKQTRDRAGQFHQSIYKVCHGFRLTTRDDYFQVNFDHFWSKHHL